MAMFYPLVRKPVIGGALWGVGFISLADLTGQKRKSGKITGNQQPVAPLCLTGAQSGCVTSKPYRALKSSFFVKRGRLFPQNHAVSESFGQRWLKRDDVPNLYYALCVTPQHTVNIA